jgi:hypothetical protein
MRNLIFTTLAAVGLSLAAVPSAHGQWAYSNPYTYSPNATSLYAIPPGGYGMRVYGPGTTFTYPYMYQSNNPYYVRHYTTTFYYPSPYGFYPAYTWSR